MNWLKDVVLIVQTAISLLPNILALVTQLEAEVSVPGFGAEKLGLIIATVKEAFALLPDNLQSKIGADKIEKFVTNVVGFIVAMVFVVLSMFLAISLSFYFCVSHNIFGVHNPTWG